MENPSLNSASNAEQKEKERVAPLGYESVSPQNWLSFDEDLDFQERWYSCLPTTFPGFHRLKQESDDKMKSKHNIEYFHDYFMKPFSYLKRAIIPILLESKIAERIEIGEYSYILGEDASGRIPTLFLGEIVKNIATLKDVKSPEVRFYAGFRTTSSSIYEEDEKKITEYKETRTQWEKGVGEFLNNLKRNIPTDKKTKILLCTETLSTGRSIKNIAKLLEEHDIDFDIVAFTGGDTRMNSFLGHDVFRGKLFAGDLDDGFRKNYLMSGVWKKNGDVHARVARIDFPDEEFKKDRNTIDNADGLAKLMSQEDAMKLSRDLAKYLGDNVAQAYIDYKAGKFELPEKK